MRPVIRRHKHQKMQCEDIKEKTGPHLFRGCAVEDMRNRCEEASS
jgi:hypothetical protein